MVNEQTEIEWKKWWKLVDNSDRQIDSSYTYKCMYIKFETIFIWIPNQP